MSVRRAILNVEELSQRILPSLSPMNPAIAGELVSHHATHPTGPHSHHALAGAGSGTYTVAHLLADGAQPNLGGAAVTPLHIIVGDIGTDYILEGRAHLAKLGNVKVEGSVLSTGFIATGHATGLLTFSNAHGSVTISLEGPSQPGFAPLPTHFQYTVVEATGAYQHVQDHGTLSLVLHPNVIPGGGAAPMIPAGQGTFTLMIP